MKDILIKNQTDTIFSPIGADQNKFQRGLYEKFPAFKSSVKINKGHEYFTEIIKSNIDKGLRVLAIDGYHGVNWDLLKMSLEKNLNGIDTEWIFTSDCFAEAEEIDKRAEPFLGGDDRIFGKHFPFGAEVFFDAKKMLELRISAAIARGRGSKKLLIILGIGSSFVEQYDQLWYMDIPKDIVQRKFKEGRLNNIGCDDKKTFEEFYKRSYFFEWPAQNRLKKKLISELDYFVDGTNEENPTIISREYFQKVLDEVSESPFRVRPWFLPGPWGGKYMQGHMGLDPNEPNIAWSYELIVPENGIQVTDGENKLEFSFDTLMFYSNKKVLGTNAAKQFKDEWPIRLDYLDTINGGNLSVQVHPRPDYIKREFGETYTQDETYYITNCKPGAKVYLGLTEDCDPEEFKNELYSSIENDKQIDLDKFVNSEPANLHDLFFIPNGTVHCSGEDNLVLEISATPYIFTFKIYDYLRKDLEGNLRPINIERGFDNIRFERREDWVQKNLIAKPELINKGKDWQEFVLYNKPFTFYNVHRVEFKSEYVLETNDRPFAINLVEGERIELETEKGNIISLAYLESMIIPAAAGKVKFKNNTGRKCKVVLVYVRPEVGISEALNDPIE
jgi:mannose-6-phosphate isomerase class I